ncbi:hypothetical protein SKAU_G00085230 [Synaphobranchus kaupii]|uniref:Uncharacterized protein n=1 Tax=Synaphobranchus kaupii TaxID=118154 RepID=A0A9Q1FVL3_SYNKA|nr:hypothetical protein SKAU_G00085230 [Synaphobranchus kaupii]
MTDSSDSESHSSFTCSEYGFERQPSFSGEQGYLHERASLTVLHPEAGRGRLVNRLVSEKPDSAVLSGQVVPFEV